MNTPYQHGEDMHNLEAPQEIVPYVMQLLQPNSVVDFGCGLGTFLHCFKNQGVEDILGLDGSWVNPTLLSKYLNADEFRESNLEKPIVLDKEYDLVISLEVAEHLHEKAADTFVENLVKAGKTILFSAAIPNQGGQNHINEQWLTYWEKKFIRHHYELVDILRPVFWNNPKVYWWYKQNMVIFKHISVDIPLELPKNPIRNMVHYELYHLKMNYWNRRWEQVISGDLSPKDYLAFFIKSLRKKLKFSKK